MEQKSKQLARGSIRGLPRGKALRGFTLLELLIVIGILAVLASAAVLVLNPAELLRQSRDATRVADLNSLHRTLGLYLTTIKSPAMDNNAGHCANTASRKVYSILEGATSSMNTFSYASSGYPGNVSASNTRATDGSGWLPVNLSSMTSGSPLSRYPIDPINTTSTASSTTYVYVYGCDDSRDAWVITARLESAKYNEDLKIPIKDGGVDDGFFEIGNAVKSQLL